MIKLYIYIYSYNYICIYIIIIIRKLIFKFINYFIYNIVNYIIFINYIIKQLFFSELSLKIFYWVICLHQQQINLRSLECFPQF